LRIRLVVVGREAPFLRAAVAEYRQRLDRYAATQVHAVQPSVWPAAPAEPEAARLLAEEAGRIRPLWRGDRRVVLARDGVQLPSEAVANWLGEMEGAGVQNVAVLVGGPGGVDASLAAEAYRRWSLGPQTLPHTLCAVVVLEQLYRGYRILRGQPYHH